MVPRWGSAADDVEDVIELLRLNYDRIVARHGLPQDEPSLSAPRG